MSVRLLSVTALASDDAAVVARSASSIAEARLPGRDAALLRALQRWTSSGGPNAAVVRLHLLDALVQTDAVVPAAALLPHLHGITEVAAFVLLARSPHVNEIELLATFRARAGDDCDDLRWLASGNLLATMRTPGFASVLLRDLEWELTLVVEAEPRPGSFARGVCRFEGGMATLVARHGSPPLPAYALQPAACGGELLAAGTHPVAFMRTRAGGPQPCGPGRLSFAPTLRLAWLHQLAEVDPGWAEPRVVAAGDDAQACAAAIACCHREYLAARRRLLSALLATGAIAVHEVGAACRPVRVLLVDGREQAAWPLYRGIIDAGAA